MIGAIAVLAVIVLALLYDRDRTARAHAKIERDLIDAVLARTPQELKVLRTEPGPAPKPAPLFDEAFEGQWGA